LLKTHSFQKVRLDGLRQVSGMSFKNSKNFPLPAKRDNDEIIIFQIQTHRILQLLICYFSISIYANELRMSLVPWNKVQVLTTAFQKR